MMYMILPNDQTTTPDNPSGAKLRLVLGMQRSGIRMMRQNLIRRYPNESPDQIDRRLSRWLSQTPDSTDPRFKVRRCKTPSKNT